MPDTPLAVLRGQSYFSGEIRAVFPAYICASCNMIWAECLKSLKVKAVTKSALPIKILQREPGYQLIIYLCSPNIGEFKNH
jgi:hypothetical protein